MPTRRLPQSNAARVKALQRAKAKNDALAAGDRFLTARTQTRMNDILVLLLPAVANTGVTLGLQSSSTSSVDLAKEIARNHISHFHQVFDFGITRSKYPQAHRAFYMRDVNSGALPPLVTEADITLQGANIATGDANRMLVAGAVAMSNPTADEVRLAVTAFNTANTTQSPLKDAYDNALQTVTGLLPEADAVIKKIWDETETFYNEETPESKRRKAREWGVFYESDVEETINILAKDSVTGTGIAAVHAEIIETGTERDGDGSGNIQLKTKAADGVTIRLSNALYISQDVTVDFVTGTTVYNITVSLVHI